MRGRAVWTRPARTSSGSQVDELMEHNSVNNVAMFISLCTVVTVGEHLAFREQIINVLSNENIWTIFGHQNVLDILWITFWSALDFRLGRI